MLRRLFLNTACLVALTGCQSYWGPEPDFGSTVNQAIRAQAVNPDAPTGNPNRNAHLDGVAAKASVDNYQKSFTTPVTASGGSGSLITINSGMTTGAAASGSP